MRGVILSFLRHLLRRKSLSVLQLLGIAFGVAAAVGMTLASRSALQSLGSAVDFLRGGTTHTIERPAGPMEEMVLVSLMADPAVKYFAPVIDRKVRLEGGQRVRLLGVDPFLDKDVRSITARIGTSRNKDVREEVFSSFLFDPGAVLIDENIAKRLQLSPGGTLKTSHGPLRVVHVFPNPSGEPLVIIDIGHAQTLFKMDGHIDRADLVVTDEGAFRARWAKGFKVESNHPKGRDLVRPSQGLQAQPPGVIALRPFCRRLSHLQHCNVRRCEQAQGCRDNAFHRCVARPDSGGLSR